MISLIWSCQGGHQVLRQQHHIKAIKRRHRRTPQRNRFDSIPGHQIQRQQHRSPKHQRRHQNHANGSGRVTIAGLGFGGTTISSDDSTSVNINENVIVDGDSQFRWYIQPSVVQRHFVTWINFRNTYTGQWIYNRFDWSDKFRKREFDNDRNIAAGD